jgi:L-malate glycosyltransferase
LARILYVEEAPAFGGSISTALHLVTRLDRSRYEPFVLFRYDLPAREAFSAAGIETATFASLRGAEETPPRVEAAAPLPRYKHTGPYRLLWSARRYATIERPESIILERWMRREGFSLVHANNAGPANISALAAAARSGIPAVSHQRGFFWFTPLHRRLLGAVQRFVCVSDAVREHSIRQGLDPARVMTIHDGVDLAALVPRPRGRGDRVLVGWFARFERWKGCAQFVEAARIVLGRRPDVEFIMAGAGPEEAAVRSAVASDPVFTGRFEVPGFRTDALELMARCDVVVNSSIEPEPLSNTALEALALGLPVVASDLGGNTEIVEHGKTGFIYEAMSPAGLAEALTRLAGDTPLRESCGAAARARAERLFDANVYAANVQRLYAEILGA